jgi:hypothetical protein
VGVRERASWVTSKSTFIQTNSSTKCENNTTINNHSDIFTWGGKKSFTSVSKERIVNPALSIYPASRVNLDTLKLLDLTIIGRGLLGKRKTNFW